MDVAPLFGCICIEDMSGIVNSGSQCLVKCKQPFSESDVRRFCFGRDKKRHQERVSQASRWQVHAPASEEIESYSRSTAKYAIGLPGLTLQQLQQAQHCAVGHATRRGQQESSRPHKALIRHISCTNNTCIGSQSSTMRNSGE